MTVYDSVGELLVDDANNSDNLEFPYDTTQNEITSYIGRPFSNHQVDFEIFRSLEQISKNQHSNLYDHNQRVGALSAKLALCLGMSTEYSALIYKAARLHDIGKVGIPDSILDKPGKLTAEEYTLVKTHCQIGADLLSRMDSELLSMAKSIAMAHHERWNGEGYPFKLVSTTIPLEARIVAVADVFDALSCKRVYKEAWCIEDIITLFTKESGVHFDPLIVEALFTVLYGESGYKNFQLTTSN